jgi:hypothetical protein
MFENLTVNHISFCNSCGKIACRSSELISKFLYAGSSIQIASKHIRFVYPPSFCKIRSSSNARNRNLTQLGLEIQTALFSITIQHNTHTHTRSNELFAHNYRYHSLPIYWTVLLNHPVYTPWFNIHNFRLDFFMILIKTTFIPVWWWIYGLYPSSEE